VASALPAVVDGASPAHVPATGGTGSPSTGPILRAIVNVTERRNGPPGSFETPDQCPYPGLRSFGEQEAAVFCGREQDVVDALVRLSRLSSESGPLVVTGASGTGKSSLLRAGVLPALAGMDACGRVAVTPRGTLRLSRWPQVVLTPGPNPFRTLAARLAPILRADAGEVAWRLRSRPEELGRLCERVAPPGGGERARLVLVVDQFEELFTAVGDPAEREAFAVAITHAWPALVMVAVRADFLDHCLRLAPLQPALGHPYLLSPLGIADLERVIAEPARLAGLELEQGLTERLIADVGAVGSPGGGPVGGPVGGMADDPGVLPRLAHALRQTWQRRTGRTLTLRGYQATGGVDRAVALTADGVYRRLPEPDRARLRTAVLRMVTVVDGGGLVRRRAGREEMPADLTNRLVEARLATADTDGVQLSHDALLTAWPRLRQWVEEDRQGLLVRQRLGEAAAAWKASGRDAGELYRGTRLGAALEWADGRDDLTDAERAFLGESRKLQRRTTRRLGVGIATLAGLLVLALIAGGLAVAAQHDAERQASAATREAAVALSRQAAAEALAKLDTDPVRAKRRALYAWRASHTREARSALLSSVVADYPESFESGVERPYAVDVSPNGRYIAVGGDDGQLALVDARGRRRVDADLGHKRRITDTAFSPDGRLLASAATDLKIWSVPSGKLLQTLPGVGRVVAWRSDGSGVAAEASPRPGTFAIGAYDPRTGRLRGWLTKPVARAAHPFRIAFGTQDTRLAIGRAYGMVELWDPRTAELVRRIPAHRDAASGGRTEPAYVTFSADRLATGTGSDSSIRLWDPRTGEARGEVVDPSFVPDEGRRSGPVVFGADGALLAPDASGRAVLRFDPKAPGPATSTTYVRGPARSSLGRSAIFALAPAENGSFIGVLLDGSVRRWSRNQSWHVAPTAKVTDVGFSPDGRGVIAASSDGLRTWDTSSGAESTPPRPTQAGQSPIAVEYGTKGELIAGWPDGRVTVTASSGHVRTIGGPRRRLFDIAVSPNDALVAAVLDDPARPVGRSAYEVRMWDLQTGTERGVVSTGNVRPTHLQFSPDGTVLRALVKPATTGVRGRSEVVTWQASDLAEVGVGVWDPVGTLGAFTLSPDGDTLVTATDRHGRIQLRDPRTGEVRRAFGRHPAPVRAIAVAADGRTIATATTEESTIRLWNVESGRLVAQLTRHRGAINDLEFSPDRRLLASAGADTDVGVWLVDPKDAAVQICADLTDAGRDGLDSLGC
jgi:WD40 repeat protein